jgi:hypothetical protein
VIVVYSPTKRSFEPASGSVGNGRVVLRLTKGESVAVLS